VRRERNRVAVVDAYLDLVSDGVAHPSIADVAARSGVSHRSVFRYFQHRDELVRVAIARQLTRIAPLLDRRIERDAPASVRAELMIRYRAAAWEEVVGVSRLVRAVARSEPVVRAQLTRRRAKLRAAVAEVFSAELGAMDDDASHDTLAALDTLLAFETYDLLRADQQLSAEVTARVLHRAAMALLGSPPDGYGLTSTP
jgi:AcrR family transcriptional regulator